MLPKDHPHLFNLPGAWPDAYGMMSPAPERWRFNAAEVAAADAFYRDVLWAVDLELHGVNWPGRGPRIGRSVLGAAADVARIWELPSADHELPRAPEPPRWKPKYNTPDARPWRQRPPRRAV